MRTNCTLIDIVGVQNSDSFSTLIANKIFHVTVLLLNYFSAQFVYRKFVTADDCSVCQQSTWYSATRTRFR